MCAPHSPHTRTSHHRGVCVHLCSRVGKSWSPCPEQDVVRRAASRVGHRAIESDRSHRAVGMPGSHFHNARCASYHRGLRVESGRTAWLERCVASWTGACGRPVPPRVKGARTISNAAAPYKPGEAVATGPVPPCFAATLRRGSERCREAPLERRARRVVVAAAPDQLRWKSILVNHVKYDAARVTGTVSGTSRQ